MLRTFILTVLALVALASNAEARERHKPAAMHERCNIDWPCVAPYASTPDQVRVTRGRYIAREMGFGTAIEKPVRKARVSRHHAKPMLRFAASNEGAKINKAVPAPSIGSAIAKPLRFIAGRLICAVNVGSALAERGIKGTGSALALSYLHWGRSAGGPVPGAVIVSRRRGGGHVAIVSRVVNGTVYAWNATGGRNGWREIPYRKAVLDYRVPG